MRDAPDYDQIERVLSNRRAGPRTTTTCLSLTQDSQAPDANTAYIIYQVRKLCARDIPPVGSGYG